MVLQAILIGLLGWLSSYECPYLGVCAFKDTISGPIAAGLFCGLILGNLQQGIIIGCAVQTIYLSNLVIGGAMSADMNWVSYVCIPLAIVSGANLDIAMALAATIGVLGAAWFTFYEGACSLFYAMGDKAIDNNNIPAMKRAYKYWPAILHFPVRFFVPFAAVMFGDKFSSVIDMIPLFVLNIGKVLGGMLPAVGMAILLAYTLKDVKMIVFYLMGLMAVKFTTINIVGVAVLGGCLAVLYYIFTDRPAAALANGADGEEDDL